MVFPVVGSVVSRRAAVGAAVVAALLAAPLPPEVLLLAGRVALACACALLAARIVAPLLPRATLTALHARPVLVTGCSSGFGFYAALALDKMGAPVLATCRNPDADSVLKLRKMASPKLRVIKMDVASDVSVAAAVEEVRKALGDNALWAVVNNAGVLPMGEALFMDDDALRDAFEVNTFGHVRVVRAFAPWLIRSKGRIVNMLSLTSKLPFGSVTPYTMTKAACLALSHGLRIEMRRFGVSVHTLAPYGYRTRLAESRESALESSWKKCPRHIKDLYGHDYCKEFKAFSKLVSFFFYSEEKSTIVADAIVDACFAKDPQEHYTPSLPATLVDLSATICPWLVPLVNRSFLPISKTNLQKQKRTGR